MTESQFVQGNVIAMVKEYLNVPIPSTTLRRLYNIKHVAQLSVLSGTISFASYSDVTTNYFAYLQSNIINGR